jgi:signal transduction histidine kinase
VLNTVLSLIVKYQLSNSVEIYPAACASITTFIMCTDRIKTAFFALPSAMLCGLRPILTWSPFQQGVVRIGQKQIGPLTSRFRLFFFFGLAFVVLLACFAVSATQRAQLHADKLIATMVYLDQIHQTSRLVDSLDLAEQRHKQLGNRHDLEQAQRLREQMDTRIWQLLDQSQAWLSAERLHPLSSTNKYPLPEFWSQSIRYAEPQLFENLTLATHRDHLLELGEYVKFIARQQLSDKRQPGYPFPASTIFPVVAGSLIVFLGLNRRTDKTLFGNIRALRPSADLRVPDLETRRIEKETRASERAIIGRDIHDELGALLMAVKIDIKRMSKDAANAGRNADTRWSAILDRVDTAMHTVTRIAENLHPQPLGQVEFWLAIESYIKDYQVAMAIPCSLRFDSVECPALPQGSTDDIFHIFQEALTNVVRHAQASRIEIEVRGADDRLEMEIADNGIGISADAIRDPRSIGICGMLERARRHGGELSMLRQPAGGTVVQLRMPMQRLQ